MAVAIVVMLVVVAFALGRLTDFKADNKITKLERELTEMTASRDRWREQYLVRVMRDKLNELNCRDKQNPEGQSI